MISKHIRNDHIPYMYCSITFSPQMGGLMLAKPVSSSLSCPRSQSGVIPRFLKSQCRNGAADTLEV